MGRTLQTAVLVLTFTACGGDDGGLGSFDADLPVGWESAERIEEFIQFPCSGSPYDYDAGSPSENPAERIMFTAAEGSFRVEYEEAQFRCAQDVEGFVRLSRTDVDILIQPVEMNPDGVAGCDCLYDITMVVDGLEERPHDITIWQRGDNFSGNEDPEQIASTTLELVSD